MENVGIRLPFDTESCPTRTKSSTVNYIASLPISSRGAFRGRKRSNVIRKFLWVYVISLKDVNSVQYLHK